MKEIEIDMEAETCTIEVFSEFQSEQITSVRDGTQLIIH